MKFVGSLAGTWRWLLVPALAALTDLTTLGSYATRSQETTGVVMAGATPIGAPFQRAVLSSGRALVLLAEAVNDAGPVQSR